MQVAKNKSVKRQRPSQVPDTFGGMSMGKNKRGSKQINTCILLTAMVITGIGRYKMPMIYAEEEEKQIILSEEEQAYIREKNTIKIGVYANDYPMSTLEKKSGEMAGIIVEVLNLLQCTSGITFDIIPIEENVEPTKLLNTREYDFIAGIPYSKIYISDKKVRMTVPFATQEVVAVGKKGKQYKSNDELKIAIPRMYYTLAESIKQHFPNCHIFVYPDNNACMEAVVYQKADVMLQNSYVVNYLLQKPFFESLEIVPTYSFHADMRIAGMQSMDSNLYSIMNKAIATLNKDDINQIVIDYTIANPYQLEFSDWVYKYAESICAIGVLIAICIIIAFEAYRERKVHRQKEQQLKYQSEIDAMTGLYNKVTIEYLCEHTINENKTKEYCFFVIDIDNFKQINDTHGHQLGDDVLCVIAEELKRIFKGDNLVGRIGGDEFAALFNITDNKRSSEEIASLLCENIHALQGTVPLSCSIGMAKVPEDGVLFSELFQKADMALYEVKKNGKDGFKICT